MDRTRWMTSLLVTVLSIGLAEAMVGSAQWQLFSPPHILLFALVYGAQVLLIATVLLRKNPHPTFLTLWSAGVLFGLYEFYFTHEFWESNLVQDTTEGPIAVVSLLVIGLIWHPLAAFILPLILTEQVVSNRPTLAGALPRPLRRLEGRRGWAALVFLAFLSGGHYSQYLPLYAPLGIALWGLLIWFVVRAVRRVPRVDDFVDALPRGRGLGALAAVVAAHTAVCVAIANAPDSSITGEQQAIALGLYAFFGLLVWRNIRHARTTETVRFRWTPVGMRPFLVFAGIASVLALVPATVYLGPAVLWYGGTIGSIVLVAFASWGALRRRRVNVLSAA